MATATQTYRGITINVTKYDDVFEFGFGPTWSYEIDGHDRPMWSSNVSEDQAFADAKAVIDQMPAVVKIKADDENYAEAFWVAFNSHYPTIAEQVRKGEAIVDNATWKKIQQLDGFSDGPSYAQNDLVACE